MKLVEGLRKTKPARVPLDPYMEFDLADAAEATTAETVLTLPAERAVPATEQSASLPDETTAAAEDRIVDEAAPVELPVEQPPADASIASTEDREHEAESGTGGDGTESESDPKKPKRRKRGRRRRKKRGDTTAGDDTSDSAGDGGGTESDTKADSSPLE